MVDPQILDELAFDDAAAIDAIALELHGVKLSSPRQTKELELLRYSFIEKLQEVALSKGEGRQLQQSLALLLAPSRVIVLRAVQVLDHLGIGAVESAEPIIRSGCFAKLQVEGNLATFDDGETKVVIERAFLEDSGWKTAKLALCSTESEIRAIDIIHSLIPHSELRGKAKPKPGLLE